MLLLHVVMKMQFRTMALFALLFQLATVFVSLRWTSFSLTTDPMETQEIIRGEPAESQKALRGEPRANAGKIELQNTTNEELYQSATLELVKKPNSQRLTNRSQYHSWGPEGIDLQQILRYINVTYYDNMTWTKPIRSYQPFAAYLVVEAHNNAPTLWFSQKTLRRLESGAGNRLKILLPHFQHALRAQLFQHRRDFPSLVAALAQHGSIPLLFDLSDYHECQDPAFDFLDDRYKTSAGVPLFTLCQSPSCQYAFPIPTYSTYEYTKIGVRDNGTNRWREIMKEWSESYPWHEKISQAYWRGGCKEERYDFVRIASNHSRYFNVRSVGNKCGKGPGTPAKAKTMDLPETSMKFKVVVDIDGNSWSERFPRLLCFNSAVVRLNVANDFEEYFMKDLIPGVHFIAANMTNFTDVGRMILQKESDAMLQKVVQNANEWCRNHMTPEQLNLDFLSILNGYVETLNIGTPNWINEWGRLEMSYVGPKTVQGGFSKEVEGKENIGRETLCNPSKWKLAGRYHV